MPPNAATLLQICEPIYPILTKELNIPLTDFIAKWDVQIHRAGSVIRICPGFSTAEDVGTLASNSC
jgi:hypothetical protein